MNDDPRNPIQRKTAEEVTKSLQYFLVKAFGQRERQERVKSNGDPEYYKQVIEQVKRERRWPFLVQWYLFEEYCQSNPIDLANIIAYLCGDMLPTEFAKLNEDV